MEATTDIQPPGNVFLRNEWDRFCTQAVPKMGFLSIPHLEILFPPHLLPTVPIWHGRIFERQFMFSSNNFYCTGGYVLEAATLQAPFHNEHTIMKT